MVPDTVTITDIGIRYRYLNGQTLVGGSMERQAVGDVYVDSAP